MTISDKPFKVPKTFNAEAFFSTRYGVLQYDGEKPERIRIRATAHQANYFRTLPLHASQKETEKADTYSIFTYHLTPNWDFVHDLLYFGDAVEGLDPESLRKRFKEESNNTANNYNHENNNN